MMIGFSTLERRIVVVICSLLIFGLTMLFSATGVLGVENFGSEFYYFGRQASCAAVGIVIMLVLSRIPYQVWGKFAFPFLFFQLVLTLLCYLPPLERPVQGVHRWVQFGSFAFQPSELAKITVAIYVAHLLAFKNSVAFHWKRKLLLVLPVVLLLAMIFKQPDLGSTILLSCMVLGVFFIAGARPVYVLGFISMGAVLFVLSLLHSDYRQRRLMAFLNPWDDPQGTGFQSIQSYLSFYSGNLLGTGLGNGNSKLFYLPEVHTDFIFALIGEELGFVGTIMMVCVFAYLGFLFLKTVRYAPDIFGRYLCFALSVSLMLQVLVNIGGVTGLIPVKGLPLPFISWGRSALLINLSMVGIILNVARQSLLSDQGPSQTRQKVQPKYSDGPLYA